MLCMTRSAVVMVRTRVNTSSAYRTGLLLCVLPHSGPRPGQTSPDKNVDFHWATASFTKLPWPLGLTVSCQLARGTRPSYEIWRSLRSLLRPIPPRSQLLANSLRCSSALSFASWLSLRCAPLPQETCGQLPSGLRLQPPPRDDALATGYPSCRKPAPQRRWDLLARRQRRRYVATAFILQGWSLENTCEHCSISTNRGFRM